MYVTLGLLISISRAPPFDAVKSNSNAAPISSSSIAFNAACWISCWISFKKASNSLTSFRFLKMPVVGVVIFFKALTPLLFTSIPTVWIIAS